MALVLRMTKGSKLTLQEMDDNLSYLETLAQSATAGPIEGIEVTTGNHATFYIGYKIGPNLNFKGGTSSSSINILDNNKIQQNLLSWTWVEASQEDRILIGQSGKSTIYFAGKALHLPTVDKVIMNQKPLNEALAAHFYSKDATETALDFSTKTVTLPALTDVHVGDKTLADLISSSGSSGSYVAMTNGRVNDILTIDNVDATGAWHATTRTLSLGTRMSFYERSGIGYLASGYRFDPSGQMIMRDAGIPMEMRLSYTNGNIEFRVAGDSMPKDATVSSGDLITILQLGAGGIFAARPISFPVNVLAGTAARGVLNGSGYPGISLLNTSGEAGGDIIYGRTAPSTGDLAAVHLLNDKAIFSPTRADLSIPELHLKLDNVGGLGIYVSSDGSIGAGINNTNGVEVCKAFMLQSPDTPNFYMSLANDAVFVYPSMSGVGSGMFLRNTDATIGFEISEDLGTAKITTGGSQGSYRKGVLARADADENRHGRFLFADDSAVAMSDGSWIFQHAVAVGDVPTTSTGSEVMNARTIRAMQASDDKIKRDYLPTEGILDALADVHACTYKMLGGDRRYLGTVAQDWEQHWPEAIERNITWIGEDGSKAEECIGLNPLSLSAILAQGLNEARVEYQQGFEGIWESFENLIDDLNISYDGIYQEIANVWDELNTHKEQVSEAFMGLDEYLVQLEETVNLKQNKIDELEAAHNALVQRIEALEANQP